MQTTLPEDLVPLVKFPSRHRREPQLIIVDPASSRQKALTVRTVANRRRKGSIDTCFNEAGTGREISSLEHVQRHLAGKVDGRRLSRSIKFYERCRTEQDHRFASKDFLLPKGWTVKEIPRSNSSHIDKVLIKEESAVLLISVRVIEQDVIRYYIEQETGKRFRSLVSAERYLNEAGKGTAASVSKALSEQVPLLAIWNGKGFETVVVDPNPQEKVKWVLTGLGGDMFSAHVSGSDVSGSVKQTWSETFVSLIQDHY